MKFNSKLLQIIINFYGLMGNQFHRLECKTDSNGYFYLAFNLVLNLVYLYYSTQHDLFLLAAMMSSFNIQMKPFFSLIISIFLMISQHVVFLLNILYIYVYGPQMTYLLNSSSFNTVPLFNNRRTVCLVVGAFTTFNLFIFYSLYRFHLSYYFHQHSLFSAGAIFIIFTYSTNLYLPLHLLLYLQYGTLVVLRQLTSSGSLPSSCSALHRARSLVLTNDRLLSLFSFPLASVILIITNCTVVSTVMYTVMPAIELSAESLLVSVYPVVTWVYIAFLVHLNERILREYDRFCSKQTLNFKKNTGWSGRCVMHELRQYQALLQLRLFGMVKIDYSFLLALGLFTLNLIVFLVQTK